METAQREPADGPAHRWVAAAGNRQRKGISEMTERNYGIARRIIHEELPDIPVGFGEFLLGLHYPDQETTQGTVFFVSKDDAHEWLRDYFNDFDASFEEVMAAKEWIEALPEFVGDMLIDISCVALPRRREKPKDVWLSLDYIDCACDENYIKPAPPPESIVTGQEVMCGVCRASFDDCPNSRVGEVLAEGLPFDEHKVEYAGKA